jgi:hypothetical protein
MMPGKIGSGAPSPGEGTLAPRPAEPGRNWTRAHRQLDRTPRVDPTRPNAQGRQYDVAPDGRFLIATVLDNSATAPITLPDELESRGEEVVAAQISPRASRSV